MDTLTDKIPHSSLQNQVLEHLDLGQRPGESFEDQVSSTFYQMEFQFWSCKTRESTLLFQTQQYIAITMF